ncbi:beta-microseminoprotein-like [Hyla sarda]|uniref:beta-microseminoprotein-like n=1 Tax=Hyla sarda TaxID=327740 RepID=UPI0024C37397|nr:beta-microseminoprotein-like [Hyla sarda]
MVFPILPYGIMRFHDLSQATNMLKGSPGLFTIIHITLIGCPSPLTNNTDALQVPGRSSALITNPNWSCEHKGKFHKIGSVWTLDCEECSCNKHGMSCCSLINTPIYDEKECVAVFHKESCSYTVTKKSNPSEPCEIKAMVG